jgi:uncharacterized protein (TIGR00297 family)
MNTINLLIGFFLAVFISALAYRMRSLDLSGALAATVLGSMVFGIGGLPGAVVLMGFFITSSGLSRLFKRRKQRFDEKFSKGSQRDAGQVLANGGVAGICILASLVFQDSLLPWMAFCGSLAAVNADTWATELGVLNRSQPILITTGKRVEPGTSGAVSLAGTLAAGAGALLIAFLGVLSPQLLPAPINFLIFPRESSFTWVVGALLGLTAAGVAGSLVDSLLGATLQVIYTCPSCQKETERHPLHTCGTPTQMLRGWRWLNNDWVNIACALTGAILGGSTALLLRALS